ncbi:HMG domain-containing protein 3 [Cheilinus undulatus]|uniref:HMG domain-containing protein 3 n=1 Tax=Cheilinus undulatus TaxID=241271 RepID=UPI001BD5928B|nr:HMG domain-containing protein 3 [Cheilinus undulatus]
MARNEASLQAFLHRNFFDYTYNLGKLQHYSTPAQCLTYSGSSKGLFRAFRGASGNRRTQKVIDKMEVIEVMKVTEEVESCYSQIETTTPKKRKNKGQEDNGEKPKKPRSAYLLYYFDVHQIMQQDIPNLPQSEINKRISESWKRLSVAEKAYYLEKAKSEKEGTDTVSHSPSKHLPGFRKILPRASYVLVTKGSSSSQQLGGTQPEVNMDSLTSPLDGVLPSVSLSKEPFTTPGLADEDELSNHTIVVDDTEEDTNIATNPAAPQEKPSTLSLPVSSKVPVSQGSAGCGFGRAMLQQIQGESTQMVAFIPTQNVLQPKSLAAVGSVGPMMMVSVGANIEQSAKPSYKMSVKTYTRRGRGRCLNPGCSFVYVTRHKPPTCPECGSHLGGKWIPASKKTQEREAASKPTLQHAKAGNSDVKKTNTNESKKEGLAQHCSRKQDAVSPREPTEGSSTKELEQLKELKDNTKSAVGRSQERSNAVVQKRPVRPILPACHTGRTLFQIITVPPDKGKLHSANNNKPSTVPREAFSGLKPNTLKQLGQIIPSATAKQNSPVPLDGGQSGTLSADKRVNILSVVPFKQPTVSSFDLGLSTARGRGRCKNLSCDYMYKNRHKPALCPKCGCELIQKNIKGKKSGSLLNPHQSLSPAQKDIQRQNTVQLLQRSLQIPENETELQDTLNLIQELNSLQIVLVQPKEQEQGSNIETETLVQSGWPQFYESAATHCGLCNYPLFKGGQGSVAGQEVCWLLTETLIQTATLQLKVCLNLMCLALHSFTDLHPGLFNVGNRLLVSIDLFLKIRASIKLGKPPSEAAKTILDHIPNHPVHTMSPEELSQIQELFLSGYWAFECLTVRDYNDMICGICGVAPKLEIAQRYMNNVLELRNVEFTWPEYSLSDEVHVDDFWLTMESEAIEQAAFPSDISITRVDASIIAPFIPPLMRSATVINTEKDKVQAPAQQPLGDPSILVRLIHDGQLRLDKIEEHSEDELRTMLDCCGASVAPGTSKDKLLASLISLYTHVHSGLSTAPQPPSHRTAGKLSKVCPHKVVCGSKYLVRRETARDHVDLLLSSRYWPPVYVSDCARQVALCADMQYPELATQMWGRNQGCFSDPFEKPELVSCAELQEQPYSADLSMVADNQQVHPVTKSSCCWLVHPPGVAKMPAEHHSMVLCRDLEPFVSLVDELLKEKITGKDENEAEMDVDENDCEEKSEEGSSVSHIRQQFVLFNNTAYYYLYNRLVDFLRSRDIVSQQINQVVKACQPGEVVIRDALYRLGVAQINTEREEDEVSGLDGQMQHEDKELYEVVLPK